MAVGGEGARRLKAELLKWRGLRRGYPKEIRERALAFARRRRAEGASYTVLASELGLSVMTLHGWLKGGRGRGRKKPRLPRLVPVEVVPEEEAKPAGAVVVASGGIRVEGLQVEQIATLLRSLA